MKSRESPEWELYNRDEKLPTRKHDSFRLAYEKNYAGEHTASDIGAGLRLFLSWLTVDTPNQFFTI